MFLDKLTGSRHLEVTFLNNHFSSDESWFDVVAVEKHTKKEFLIGTLYPNDAEEYVLVDWNEIFLTIRKELSGRVQLQLFAVNRETGQKIRLVSVKKGKTLKSVGQVGSTIKLQTDKNGQYNIVINERKKKLPVKFTKMEVGIRNQVMVRWAEHHDFKQEVALIAQMRRSNRTVVLVENIAEHLVRVQMESLTEIVELLNDDNYRFDLYAIDQETGEKFRLSVNDKKKSWTNLIQLESHVAETKIYVAKSGELSIEITPVKLPFLDSINDSGMIFARPESLLGVPLSIAVETANGEHATYPFENGENKLSVPFTFFNDVIGDQLKGIRATDDTDRVRGVMVTTPGTLINDENGQQWLITGNKKGRLNIKRSNDDFISGSKWSGSVLTLTGKFTKNTKVVMQKNSTKRDYLVLPTDYLDESISVDLMDVYDELMHNATFSGTLKLYLTEYDGHDRVLEYDIWKKIVRPMIVGPGTVQEKQLKLEDWPFQIVMSQTQNGNVQIKLLDFKTGRLKVRNALVYQKKINFVFYEQLSEHLRLVLVDKNNLQRQVAITRTEWGAQVDIQSVKALLDGARNLKKTMMQLLIQDVESGRLYKMRFENKEQIFKKAAHSRPYPLTEEGLPMLAQSFQLRRSKDKELTFNLGSWHNLQRRRFKFGTSIDSFEMTETGYRFDVTFTAKKNEELEIDYIFLVNRNKLIAKSFELTTTSYSDSEGVHVTATLDPQDTFLPIYLDVFAQGTYRGESVVIQVRHASDEVVNKLTTNVFDKERDVLVQNAVPGESKDYLNYLMYPYITINGNLAFEFRQRKYFETPENQALEMEVLDDFDALNDLKMQRFGDQKVWVVFEKNAQGGHDNGFHFFKYLYQVHPEIQAFYVIETDSPDYRNLANMSDRVLPFMSRKYFETLAMADLLISSDTKYHVYNTNRRSSLMGQILAEKPLIYLQHGVNGLKQVPAFHKNRGLLDFVMVPDDYEKTMVVNQWGYNADEVAVTGLARWDSYFDKTSEVPFKQIFVMPTWRKWMDGMTAERFVNTPFYKEYNAFLNSDRLKTALLENNVRIAFFLHPYFKDYVHLFNVDESIIDQYGYLDVDMGEEIMRSSMMISDYSSVLWDMYYLKKPVLFYQFDQENYLETEKSYMNYDTELFGDVAFTADDVIDEIIGYANNNFAEKPVYSEMRKKYFTYMDQSNSERIFKTIVEKF